MKALDPRIKNALLSIDPTIKNLAWHGTPTAIGVLRGVNSTVAVWRPYPDGNNIREIALHIAFWENSIANRLSGNRVRVRFRQWKMGWVIKCDSLDGKQWKNEVALVKSVHARLVEAVRSFDPDLLDMPVGKQIARNAIEFILGVGEGRLY